MGRYAVVLIIVVGVCGSAHAGQVNQMFQTPVDVAALQTAPDGQWLEGRDWDYVNDTFWIMEEWVGGPGDTVSVNHGIEVLGRSVTPIDLQKMLTNETNFMWTSFEMMLLPNTGASIDNVTANANPEFFDVSIIDLNNGGWKIVWDTIGGGTGVPVGQDTTIEVNFEIDGNISFNIEQTPIPEPASLVLLGLGMLAMMRRR